jgi:hypothetical protein
MEQCLKMVQQLRNYACKSFQNDSKWWIYEQWYKLFGDFFRKIEMKKSESVSFSDLDLSFFVNA